MTDSIFRHVISKGTGARSLEGTGLWGLLKRPFGRMPLAPTGRDWGSRLPGSVAFCDVETTGLHGQDRIVSFAGIGLNTASLAREEFDLVYFHLVFDPSKRSHRKAEQVHGYSDWVLRFQNPFSVYADELWGFLSSFELLVAHNAVFDFSFINREFTLLNMPPLKQRTYCTMEAFRALGVGGSASLNAVCQRIHLARAGNLHGALEDAWLAMQVYLWLNGCPVRAALPDVMPPVPTNLHEAPPMLEKTPRRKRITYINRKLIASP